MTLLVSACAVPSLPALSAASGVHKIQHIVVIMQENRTMDEYFGTYPGVDGLPRQSGQFTVCIPDPNAGQCARPYHDPNDVNGGGPHGEGNAVADIDGGKMDGFVAAAERGAKGCLNTNDPACTNGQKIDVMGYKDARDIPNYWTYAHDFTLQDHMFEPNASWSLPEHLFLVSEWSAKCSNASDPQSCVNALQNPEQSAGRRAAQELYAWTDLTYLLFKSRAGSTTLPTAPSPTAKTPGRTRASRSPSARARRASGTRSPGSLRCIRTSS